MTFTATDISNISTKITMRRGKFSIMEATISFSSKKNSSRKVNLALPQEKETDQTAIQEKVLNILNADSDQKPEIPLPSPFTFVPKA